MLWGDRVTRRSSPRKTSSYRKQIDKTGRFNPLQIPGSINLISGETRINTEWMEVMRSRKPTLEDVAALAGVSQATISRLLNGHTEVCTLETAQRIHDAIVALGYIPPSRRSRQNARGAMRNEATTEKEEEASLLSVGLRNRDLSALISTK